MAETWVVRRIGDGEIQEETITADSCYVDGGCLVFIKIKIEDLPEGEYKRIIVRAYSNGEWLDMKLVKETE